MAKLYCLRHGALAPNPEHCFIGQQDLPLAAEGRRQAALWRKALWDVPFTFVWTSDLTRCRTMTALVLARRQAMPQVQLVPALREIDLGQWQGLPKAVVQARYPALYASRGQDIEHTCPPQGESFAMLRARVLPAMHQLALLCQGQDNALVVTHAGVLRVLLAHSMALTQQDIFALPLPYAACIVFDAADFLVC
jgi:broad specificity phosphatase PhoE